MASIVATPDVAFHRTRLDVTTVAAASYIQVQRSTDGGATWAFVRGDDTASGDATRSTVTGGVRTVYDAEAPFDVTMIYQARGVNPVTSLVEPWSPASLTVTLPAVGDKWVLHPVTLPGAGVAVDNIAHTGTVTAPVARGVFYPMRTPSADVAPVVVFGGRRARSGSGLSFYVPSDLDLVALDDILTSEQPVVIRAPGYTGWRDIYVVVGDVTWVPDVPLNAGMRRVTFSWTAIASPVAYPVTSFGATWDQITATVATWDQLAVLYPTWNDVLNAVL